MLVFWNILLKIVFTKSNMSLHKLIVHVIQSKYVVQSINISRTISKTFWYFFLDKLIKHQLLLFNKEMNIKIIKIRFLSRKYFWTLFYISLYFKRNSWFNRHYPRHNVFCFLKKYIILIVRSHQIVISNSQ